MSYMKINPDNCIGCGECAANCPFEAVEFVTIENSNHKKASIGTGCRLCSTCEMVCEHDAICFVSGEGTGTVQQAEDFHF